MWTFEAIALVVITTTIIIMDIVIEAVVALVNQEKGGGKDTGTGKLLYLHDFQCEFLSFPISSLIKFVIFIIQKTLTQTSNLE